MGMESLAHHRPTATSTVWWTSIPSVRKRASSPSSAARFTWPTAAATTATPRNAAPTTWLLLARDNTGYRNLMQLVTIANLEGFHYRPRIDWELLQQYEQGLVCLSGCASAEVPRPHRRGQHGRGPREAIAVPGPVRRRLFPGTATPRTRPASCPEINNALARFSEELGHSDGRYTTIPTTSASTKAPYQDLYICIQTNTTVQDDKRLRMEDNSYYVKTPAEMGQLFSDHPRALDNTQLIADMCNVELGFGQTHLPKFPTPNDIPAEEYLAQLCWEGFRPPLSQAHRRGRGTAEVRTGGHSLHPVRQLFPGGVGHLRLRATATG